MPKRKDYISWEEYFMGIVKLSEQRSKDPSTQVGACITSAKNRIIAIGYNGMPNGISDDVIPWDRDNKSNLDNKYLYVCHAELNAIMNSNNSNLEGCIMYVSLFPCNECAKLIIQSGIKKLIYDCDKYCDIEFTLASKKMLELAGVECIPYKASGKAIMLEV